MAAARKKESLHEHDHVLPAHWPSGLDAAADSIDHRVEQLLEERQDDDTSNTLRELIDLVEWAPEVAADTDLPESEWIGIHNLSQTLQSHLQADKVSVAEIESDFRRLSAALRNASQIVQTLPTTGVISN